MALGEVALVLLAIPLASLLCWSLFRDWGYWYAHWQASTDEVDAWRRCFVPFQHWVIIRLNLPAWLEMPLRAVHHSVCFAGPAMWMWATGPLRYFVRYYLLR